ncbi:hypothetical protein GCM10027402_35330 [Arthrobacter monumenti]
MFGSAVLFQLVIVVLMGLTAAIFFGLGADIESFIQPDGLPTAAGLGFGAGALGAFLLIGLLDSASVFVLQGVLVIPVSRSILNEQTSFKDMWARARGRIWPLVGLALVVLLATIAVLIATVVLGVVLVSVADLSGWIVVPLVLAMIAAGIWAGIKIVLAPAALVLENIGIFASIRRSWILVKRNWWRTFGIVALTVIIVGIVTSVVTVPLEFLISFIGAGTMETSSTEDVIFMTVITTLISALISTLFAAIGYAFQAGVTALLYVDLRMRHEGFDVVLMKEAEQLAGSSGPGPSALPNQGPDQGRGI